MTHIPEWKTQAGTNAPQSLSRPSTTSMAANSAAATNIVPKGEGLNRRSLVAVAVGIAAPPPNLPPAAQYKCRKLKIAKIIARKIPKMRIISVFPFILLRLSDVAACVCRGNFLPVLFIREKDDFPLNIVASDDMVAIIKNVHAEVNIVLTGSLLAIFATNVAESTKTDQYLKM